MDSCPLQASTCVSILPRPVAQFSTVPAATGNTLSLCKGETVQFTNTSEDAPQTEWDFGDGTSSVLDEPLHTFWTPGTYEVKLIARNGCACADTSSLLVVVSDAEIPEIQCVGPICLGDSATYRTNVSCGNYQWSISPNGSIIGGGSPSDDFVTVRWQGIGSGTGSIELSVSGCTTNVCDKPVREVVGILGGPVAIEGPSIVCPNTVAEYSIPAQHGSDISWSVSGIGNLIAEGQSSNKITVQWGSTGGTVSVSYANCFLECGGSGQKQVSVRPPSYIEGPIEICVGNNPIFRHKSLVNNGVIQAAWQILDASGAVIWSSNGTPIQVSPTWNFAPGQYTIRAVPSNSSGSCSAESGLPVTLLGPPPAPGILGASQICPSNIFTYTAQSSLPSASFEWQVKNGSSTTTKVGNAINVKWGNTPPYALTLRQTDESGPGCPSTTTTLELQPLPPFSISGPPLRCKESTAVYTTTAVPDIDYQWIISPTSAGAVLSGQGSPTVEVFWQALGTATLELRACGNETVFPVEITSPVAPVVAHPDSLCPGATATVSVLGSFTDIVWKNADGNTLSTSPSPSLGPGHYTVEATDAAGCTSGSGFFIAPLPSPTTAITALVREICPDPVRLHALQTQDGYSFQWQYNGSNVGTDQPIFDANQIGSYRVQVTDANGCTALSDPLFLTDCSSDPDPGDPNPGQCDGDGEVLFLPTTLSTCDSVQMLNLSQNLLPNTQSWWVRNTLDDTWQHSTELEPVFVFDEPGFYQVVLLGRLPNASDPDGPSCPDAHVQFVMVPLIADFSAVESCAGLPTRFTDGSTFMPDTDISAWHWDFGDGSAAATEQHPSHVFGQTGDYLVRLTVTSSTGCKTSFAKLVTVHGFPSVSFDPPAAICAATALQFTAAGANGAVSYSWDFGDPASGSGNFSQNQSTWHAYPAPANYPVTVTAANVYGCTASYSASVSIEANDLTGSIIPEDPAPICQGLSAALTAPGGGSSWSWSNGATTSSINTSTAGVYAVTITDLEGCEYKPEPVVLDVLPAPVASIRAVELNEFGQAVAYHPQGFTACEGEDVNLEMVGDPKYTYVWAAYPPLQGAGGWAEEQLSFTEMNATLLPAGQHSYTVTVTDIITGCTAVVGPFPVTVNAAPASVAISSNPPGPLCDGTVASFSLVNPQPDLSYLWNTGSNGTSMTAAAAGSYLVVATNQYGCTAKSNDLEIHNAPSVSSAPAGCYTRCTPAEICLPQMPEVADYQWFLNGTAIPAPAGTTANLPVTESGDYQVRMTSVYGCVSLSDPLSLSLEAPFGNIGGTVWLDANDNGLVDPQDTPLAGVSLALEHGGSPMGQAVSGTSGGFVFENMPSESYAVLLDTASLPNHFQALNWSQAADLQGCRDSTGVAFLVKNLCPASLVSTVQLSACEGTTANYLGTAIPAGDAQEFLFSSYLGCDSLVTVSVAALAPTSASLTLFGCPGDSVAFASQMVAMGETAVVVLQNQVGCDSVINLTTSAYPVDYQLIGLSSCPGEPVVFDGQNLMPGDTATFVYQNLNGCDSTVVVTVGLFQAPTPTVMEMQVCTGDSLVYNGETLWPGDVLNVVFQDEHGCDSLVNVSVSAYPAIEFELLTAAICPGSSTGFVEVAFTSGDAPLSTSLDGSSFASTDFYEGQNSGSHAVQVRDAHGCLASQSVDIQELAPLELATEDYLLPCDEPLVTLRPEVVSHSGSLHWQWSDGSTKDWLHAREAGVFRFEVSDDCSSAAGSVTVAWGDDVPTGYFYLPNAFSPNDDGVNDTFRAYPAEGVDFQAFELKVFDRWGELLFESDDAEHGWDGTHKGQLMDTGVVVWYVYAKVWVCGRSVEVYREGGVTVVR